MSGPDRGGADVEVLRPVPLDRSLHRTESFDSGVAAVDGWLRTVAGQAERRGAARMYVATDEAYAVLGYVTLAAGQIAHASATQHVAQGMSRHYPIPVALIARLALDRSIQGRGGGAALLDFALGRCIEAGSAVGVRAVVVDAIDERAAGFYRRFRFESLPEAPLRLMATMDDLRAAFGM